MYKKYPDGFYVRAEHNECTPDITIKYISRYLGRPVIATSRIDDYDGDMVTFHYTRHEDNQTITECIPAMYFIKRLIVHIPEKHFKMLRYYGIYAKHHKQEKICVDASPKKNNVFFYDTTTGARPLFFHLDMIRYVVLPYRFWKFTTKNCTI